MKTKPKNRSAQKKSAKPVPTPQPVAVKKTHHIKEKAAAAPPTPDVSAAAASFLSGGTSVQPALPVVNASQELSGSPEFSPEEISGMDILGVMTEMARVNSDMAILTAKRDALSEYLQNLHKRWSGLQDDFRSAMGLGTETVPTDGRKIYNPEKNLKISAIRAYGWAKKAKRNADDAKVRVLERTMDSARKKYGMTKLPDSVVDYINEWHAKYDQIKEEDFDNVAVAAA